MGSLSVGLFIAGAMFGIGATMIALILMGRWHNARMEELNEWNKDLG